MHSMVSFKKFFLSLSSLLDIGDPNLSNHQLKTAFISWKIGVMYELNEESLNDLIIASLVHDIGALSLEEKIDLKNSQYEDMDMHSYRGWYILQKVPSLLTIANAVKYHHTSYKELKNSFMLAQILHLADMVDRNIQNDKHILEQQYEIIGCILNSENLHPILKDIFVKVSRPENFWLDLTNIKLQLFFDEAPISDKTIPEDVMLGLSFLIRDIIDFKSPFTLTHSMGVMFCAYHLGTKEGYSEKQVEDLAIAGLLHDVGKLTVPNNIIMKNGALNDYERALMTQHPYYTYRFLKDACYSKSIIFSASCHHEDLVGHGYPFKYKNHNLNDFDKIMAVCDVFVALHEDRPYRKGLSKPTIERIMNEMTEKKLEKKFVVSLLEEYEYLKIGLDEMLFENKLEYQTLREVIF